MRRVKIIRELYGLRKDAFFVLDPVSPLPGYQVQEFIAPLMIHTQDIPCNLYIVRPDQIVGL
ncbi:MAG: hypothetical protein JRH09_11215 [Deltaproteobacteria bacterium]|nr:hypothetical protein [Deltaproteobacteria bacterium]